MSEPLTMDDRKVANLANNLPRLSTLGDAPELPESAVDYGRSDELQIDARGRPDGTLDTEHFGGDIESLAGTEYYDHLRRLVEWAYEAGAEHVVIGGSFVRHDDHDLQYASVSVHPFGDYRFGGYSLRLKYNVTGDVFVALSVNPLRDTEGGRRQVYVGNASDMPVEEVQDDLDSEMPYVGSRVHELIEEHGATESQAKARALWEVGFSHDEIGDRLGVSTGASQSYVSKLNSAVRESRTLSLACTDPPKRVLSSVTSTEGPNHERTMYVCCEVASGPLGPDAWLITRDEYGSEYEDYEKRGGVEMMSRRYPSVEDVFRAHAGQDMKTLDSPWTYLLQDTDSAFIGEDVKDELEAKMPVRSEP